MIKYDPFLGLATAVLEVLAGSEALRPKEIAHKLRLQGWGNPPISAVNKVLTQYLAGRVSRDPGGYWRSAGS